MVKIKSKKFLKIVKLYLSTDRYGFRSKSVGTSTAVFGIKADSGIIALAITVVAMFLATSLSLSAVFVFLNRTKAVKNLVSSYESAYAAESGIEDAVYRIRNSMNVPASYTLVVGRGLTTVSVNSPSSNTRTVSASGEVRNVFRKSQTRLTLSSVTPDFFYGMQVGAGGVKVLGDNVQIIGNVFSNGNIVGGIGFNITGDAIVAGGTETTPDQEWTVQNSNFLFGREVSGINQYDAAQSFQISKDSTLSKVTLYIKKVGSPSDITIRINKDKNGRPGEKGGDVLAQGTLFASQVTGDYGWVDISLSSVPELEDDKTYWIIADGGDDSLNYWVWGYDNTNAYADGEGKYNTDEWNNKSEWNDIEGDLNFRVWLGGINTSIDNATVDVDVRANTITNTTVGQDAYGETMSDVTIMRDVFASSISDCTVGGDAFYNTISGCTVSGTSTTPTTPPIDPAPGTWSISDGNIATWKAEADAGTLISSTFVIPAGQTVSLGPARVTGNMELNASSTLIITGTIWVEGSIDVKKDNTRITLDPSYESSSGVIISDGTMHFGDEVNLSGTSDPDSFILFVVLATGGGHHGLAVDFHKDSNVDAVIFVPNGGVRLHERVHVTQLTADYIEIDEDSIVEYDSGLENVNFSTGPSAGWSILSWKETE